MNAKLNTYYIGDLSEALGLSQRTIRYYEELGFLRPSRTSGGFRIYSARDMDFLRMVIRFKDLGMSLTDIRSLLLPSSADLTSVTFESIKDVLKARRGEFETKAKKYQESIEQLDGVLELLSKCISCGQPGTKSLCDCCLREHEKNGKNIAPFISSLFGGDDPQRRD